MTVWSLTTDTDLGLMTRLYLTEDQAYDALSRFWFPDYGDETTSDAVNFKAMQAALAEGIPEAGESAVSKWFDVHREEYGCIDRAVIERHDHPWMFIEGGL